LGDEQKEKIPPNTLKKERKTQDKSLTKTKRRRGGVYGKREKESVRSGDGNGNAYPIAATETCQGRTSHIRSALNGEGGWGEKEEVQLNFYVDTLK